MRIHLISPTHYLRDGSLHKTTRYWTSGVTLPYLKALTPPSNQVTFTDELMADLDLARVEREADVIGLTAMGPQIRRAYDLADHFRARGKQVVLGGTWVSLVPEESLRHADAVVAGEAEYVWQDVLADLAARGGEGALPPPDPVRDAVGEPGDNHGGARPGAARLGRAPRRASPLDRLRGPRRGGPGFGGKEFQPPEPLQGGHREAPRA